MVLDFFLFDNSIVTTMGKNGFEPLILLIKEDKQYH